MKKIYVGIDISKEKCNLCYCEGLRPVQIVSPCTKTPLSVHEPVQSNLHIHETGDLGVHQRPSVHMDRLQSGLGSFFFGFTVQDVGLERVLEVA